MRTCCLLQFRNCDESNDIFVSRSVSVIENVTLLTNDTELNIQMYDLLIAKVYVV